LLDLLHLLSSPLGVSLNGGKSDAPLIDVRHPIRPHIGAEHAALRAI